jgi:hypothetical protein
VRTIRIDHCFHVQNKISIPRLCDTRMCVLAGADMTSAGVANSHKIRTGEWAATGCAIVPLHVARFYPQT